MESAEKFKSKRISRIPNNMETYIAFTPGNLGFIDSLQFLNASLDTLISNLAEEGGDNFHALNKHFAEKEEQKLLLGKGAFPYDYLS